MARRADTAGDGAAPRARGAAAGPQARRISEGIATREAAAGIAGARIEIERAALPALREREHYQADLIGYVVRNIDGVELGRVAYFVDLPGNAVMVVEGGREHWVPMTPAQLLQVDREARVLLVDWPAEI